MSTNTKKKRGTGAAVVIIVLCLAALGALGYVIWQQFHPAVPETAAGYVASAESTAPVYDENGELLGSLPRGSEVQYVLEDAQGDAQRIRVVNGEGYACIDRANLTIRLIEKKVALDDKKDFYLSTKVFACTQAMPEKAKLKAVCETAVAAVQQAYPEPEQLDDVPPFDGGTETAVELLVRNQAVDNQISVEDVRERIRENFPLAAPRFEEALAETGVQENDRVTVTPARIRRMESRSIRTANGIEVKIPTELLNSDSELEFLHDPDGSVSLLIKNVIL